MEFIKNINPTIGSIVRVKRTMGYYHYGVMINDNIVCHYSGTTHDDINNPDNVKIIETSIQKFKKDDELEVMPYNEKMLPLNEIINRCNQYLGKSEFNGMKYNIVTNNCEHFARWAALDEINSEQVNQVFNLLKNLFN